MNSRIYIIMESDTMSTLPQISDAEWNIMSVVWENEKCTANEIVDVLSKTTTWSPKTIKTMINRLVKKEALSYEVDSKDKRTYHYFSKVSEDECIKEASSSFIKRVFKGSLNAMMANFVKEAELTEEDIEELKNILDKKKD